MAEDVTVEILKQIRDGMLTMNRDLSQKIDETNSRLERLDSRVTERLDRVEGRLGRVEQGLLDLGKFMKQIALDLAKQERWHNQHVKVLEKDVSSLKARVGKLEKKKGA